LAISSQGESFVVIDKDGNALRNTIVWLDSRSKEEAIIIKNEFGSDNIYRITGCPEVDPCWASTKLLWIKMKEPDVFKKIYKILLIEDYLIYRLTGNFACNGSLYCESLLYDINSNNWWEEILDFIGINSDQLPDLYPSGVKVGEVSHSAAEDLGIFKGCIVVSAGMDQACGCIGTGNISPGIVTENTGSAVNVAVTTDKPVFDPKRRVPCLTHAVTGKYIYLPWDKTAGMILKWFKDNFYDEEIKTDEDGIDAYDLITKHLDKVPPGSNGVILLPYFDGTLSPEIDENARGVFYGLSLSTKREHFVKSILESVSYMLRAIIELIEEAHINVKEIISSGGASKNILWNQIKADVLGKRIVTLKNQDSGCLGAAILAGVGLGIFNSIQEACNAIIKKDRCFEPVENNKLVYDNYYLLYKEIYNNLKPVFQKFADINKICESY
jgi:xylulokinase